MGTSGEYCNMSRRSLHIFPDFPHEDIPIYDECSQYIGCSGMLGGFHEYYGCCTNACGWDVCAFQVWIYGTPTDYIHGDKGTNACGNADRCWVNYESVQFFQDGKCFVQGIEFKCTVTYDGGGRGQAGDIEFEAADEDVDQADFKKAMERIYPTSSPTQDSSGRSKPVVLFLLLSLFYSVFFT